MANSAVNKRQRSNLLRSMRIGEKKSISLVITDRENELLISNHHIAKNLKGRKEKRQTEGHVLESKNQSCHPWK